MSTSNKVAGPKPASTKGNEAKGKSTAASPSEFRAHWHVDPVEGRRRREAGPFSTLLAEHDSRIDRRFEVLEWVKALPSRKVKS